MTLALLITAATLTLMAVIFGLVIGAKLTGGEN